MQRHQINGATITGQNPIHLTTPIRPKSYTNAQLDNYAGTKRRHYPNQPQLTMQLEAKFSHSQSELIGTAGFGFWNAPAGDVSARIPTLPQAVWFFFGSPPNHLPFLDGATGLTASTIDAARFKAWGMAPFAPITILLNQIPAIRERLWPLIRRRLGIRVQPLNIDITIWHTYALKWQPNGCQFWVDGTQVLSTSVSPRGPLGFVCWIDNQYMVATPTGRFGGGLIPQYQNQSLVIKNLHIDES